MTARPLALGRPLFALWLAWLSFVVYGSLVPLERNQRSLSEALRLFREIPYFDLGVASRADWIANGVLYLPLGLLSAYGLMQARQRSARLGLILPAWAFCCAVAVAVEFFQIFFPPRTVSLNDLLAESIGSLLGVGLAFHRGDWLARFLTALWRSEGRLRRLALQGYLLAYLAFSLFPYDFLISLAEIRDKVASPGWGWLLAGGGHGLGRSVINALVETVATLPLGYYLAGSRPVTGLRRHAAFGIGAGLGLALELLQFFLASGSSQGLSVLTRALGVAAGARCWRESQHLAAATVQAWLRRLSLPGGLAYLPLLGYVSGYLSHPWQGWAAAREQWAAIHWLPFYYHYYTTEMVALHSLVSVAAAYAPLAVFAWAWRRGVSASALAALSLSVVVEAGKCFLAGTHPDPTNVLVAVGGAGLAATSLARLLASGQEQTDPWLQERAPPAPDALRRPLSPVLQGLDRAQSLWVLPALLGVGWWLLGFPSATVLVAGVLLAGALAVWRRPAVALALLPAALPVFDLAPWSGRLFFDEFDALALVCLGLGWLRTPAPAGGRSRLPPLDRGVLLLAAASLVIGVVRGLGTPAWPDLNSFLSYYSGYNALRVGKGLLWAALAGGLAWRLAARGIDALRPVAWGFVAGLLMCVASVVWERLAFASLADFSGEYRVTGLISAMHTGGAYLEAYLVVAIPFLVALVAGRAGWSLRLAGGALLLAATYALAVTFSRGGYAGFGVAVLAVLGLAPGVERRRGRALAWSGALLGGVLLVAFPVVHGGFAQARLEVASSDWAIRQAHWRDIMQIRDDDLVTVGLGMGLGSFPAAYYWRSAAHPRSASYALEREADNAYLRLAAGDAVGLEQIVAMDASGSYRLSVDLKPGVPRAGLTLAICEKWLLTSARCHWEELATSGAGEGWQRVERTLRPSELAQGGRLRPLKLSLSYAQPGSTLAVDNIRLTDGHGVDLLANGNFSHGLDHWFFVANGTWHGHWHPHSLWYGTLFELGWLGVLALSALILLAALRAIDGRRQGASLLAAPVAALAGVLTMGVSDTVLDAPRFLFLFLLLNLLCVLRVRERAGIRGRPSV
jgi:VanZ family protein